MGTKLQTFKTKYKSNPGWYWLIASALLFPLLPEYISPFILFIGFIVFKRQWTKEGKKARMGELGKLEFIFLCYTMLSVIWSDTRSDSFWTSALWFGMFLIQVMVYNLANTRAKIDKVVSAMVAGGAINGLMGVVQICSYTLYDYGCIPKSLVFVTPFYRQLDTLVYNALPFKISTDMWASRASGMFSNPNLLATYMVLVYPLSMYLFLNAKTKKQKIIYFIANVLISGGISSTMTRGGCIVALLGWLIMAVFLFKRYYKKLLLTLIPTAGVIVPSLLSRYGLLFNNDVEMTNSVAGVAISTEAKDSSSVHLQIWGDLFDYIFHHVKAFICGTGFGLEQTGNILLNEYNLDKPHAHNFVIEFWTELGIIGLVLFIAIVIVATVKMAVVNANNGKKLTLVVTIITSLALFLMFGLTDFVFNSPKQIFMFFIVMGLIQCVAHVYESSEFNTPDDLIKIAKIDLENAYK